MSKNEIEYTVDLRGVSDKEELHDRIEKALPLPEHYGRNLDALYDALQEISGVITFEGTYDGTYEGTYELSEVEEADPPGEGDSENLIVSDASEIDAKLWNPYREYLNDLRMTLRDAEIDNPDLQIYVM